MRLFFFAFALLVASSGNAQFLPLSGGDGVGVPAVLTNGDVLIVDGSAELYDVRMRVLLQVGLLPVAMTNGAAVAALPDGRAIVTGGRNDAGVRNYVLLWDRRTYFQQIAGMSVARSRHAMTALSADRVLIVGGDGSSETRPGGSSFSAGPSRQSSTRPLAYSPKASACRSGRTKHR
jgi:hypothetical protein